MIRLTSEEILAMNGLLDGKTIEGLAIKASEEPEGERLQKVNKSLTAKEFLINGKLSDKFMATAELLKSYKASNHKIFINNLRIAVIDDTYTVVLDLLPDGDITISYTPAIVVVKKYIEALEFLKQGQKERFFEYEKEPRTEEEYEVDLNSREWENLMVVQTYLNQRMSVFKTYYFDDKEAFCFDHIKKMKQQRGPKDFRLDIVKLFDIEADDEYSHFIN